MGANFFSFACSNNDKGENADNLPSQRIPMDLKYKISDFNANVLNDLSYKLNFKLNETLDEGDKFYFSQDSIFDSGDIETDFKISEDIYQLIFDEAFSNFYIFITSGKADYIKCIYSVTLPQINLIIKSGSGTQTGSDVVKIDSLISNLNYSNYVKEGSFNVYRSASKEKNLETASKVVSNASITTGNDEYLIPFSDDEIYYFYEIQYLSTKVYSQVFTKNDIYDDLLTIHSMSLNRDGTLEIEGTYGNEIKNIYLGIYSDRSVSLETINSLDNGHFNIKFNSKTIFTTNDLHRLFFGFAGGTYLKITKEIFDDDTKNSSLILGDKVYFLTCSEGYWGIKSEVRNAINLTNVSLKNNGDLGAILRIEGAFDLEKLDVKIYNPVLCLKNNQDSVNDNNETKIIINSANNSFVVETDLKGLKKDGYWYDMMIYFDSTKEGGNYKYPASYVIKESDCANRHIIVNDPVALKRYNFETYEGLLKLNYTDDSSKISTWEYLNIDEKMHLRIKGLNNKGSVMSFSVYTGTTGNRIDERVTSVRQIDGTSFVVDIPIDYINESTVYHILRNSAGISSELTSKTCLYEPHSALSDKNGFIYCIKKEQSSSTIYYKIYKDREPAKILNCSFGVDGENNPILNLFGVLNSEIINRNNFVGLYDEKNELISYRNTKLGENNDSFSVSVPLMLASENGGKYKLVLGYYSKGKRFFYYDNEHNLFMFDVNYLPENLLSELVLVRDYGVYQFDKTEKVLTLYLVN